MLDFSNVQMKDVVIHRVGNKSREEDVILSNASTRITDEHLQQLLLEYLLSPFRKMKAVNCFSHSTELRFNEVYTYLSQVFSDEDQMLEQSIRIARHLYDHSTHPRIKGGEFYMVYFAGIKLGDVEADAVGMFRTENKETYLKVSSEEHAFSVTYEDGININALDKGCLVLNIDADNGYKVFIVDSHGKAANEARYWKDDFLRVVPVTTEEAVAQSCIQMVGRFVDETFQDEDRMKPVEMKSKMVQFFEDNTTFDMARFEDEVIQEPTHVRAFRNYRREFEDTNGVDSSEAFPISKATVQSVKKRMKSVIKLDSRFDIYVRGHQAENLKFIERGREDAKGMNFYKIYFNEEN